MHLELRFNQCIRSSNSIQENFRRRNSFCVLGSRIRTAFTLFFNLMAVNASSGIVSPDVRCTLSFAFALTDCTSNKKRRVFILRRARSISWNPDPSNRKSVSAVSLFEMVQGLRLIVPHAMKIYLK